MTLPICLIFGYWLWASTEHYATFGVRHNSSPIEVKILGTGQDTLQRMKRHLQLAISPKIMGERDQKLDTVNIFISESDIAKLEEHLPHSGMEYVKGRILIDGEVRKMSARYRGDTYLHWGSPKKSLRIKTKKKHLYKGMRKFNLLTPKSQVSIVNYSTYRLAAILGLIVPKTEMVDVILNGRPRGVHLMVEQLEELTLRSNKRMPGDIYSGELFAKDHYIGISPYVFEHPGLWDKAAANNHFELTSNAPLERLIRLLNDSPSEKSEKELSELLDIEAWGRFAAFEMLTQTSHFDQEHNWRIYYDPWRQKFEPLIWDPLGWVTLSSHKLPLVTAVSRTKLHNALYRNTKFIVQKYRVLRSFYDKSHNELFLNEIDLLSRKLSASIMHDPHLVDPNSATAALARYRTRIENVIEMVRSEIFEEESDVAYANTLSKLGIQKLKLKVDGQEPIEELVLNYAEKVTAPHRTTVSFWVNGEKTDRDISGAVQPDGNRLTLRASLISNYQPEMRSDVGYTVQKTRPAYYEFTLDKIDSRLLEVLVKRRGKQPGQATKNSDIGKISFIDAFNVIEDIPIENIEVWAGDITLSGINHFSNKIVIEKGTNILLEPGASVIFNNRVTARGTAEQPITFSGRAGGEAPWGTIAIEGQNANGSAFTYCEFSGGSGFKGELFEYSGMFSIHDVQGLSIANSKFQDSYLVDDMVHAVYSDLRISDSEFRGALFDALDLDISKAKIVDSLFIDNGNDSIDLMGTDLTLLNSSISKSGDKGISVGEGSRLLAINNRIENSAIGVQSKDGSVAVLYNVALVQNKHAVDAYKKNWRYASGGYLYIYKSEFQNNTRMATADKQSKIKIYDSAYDQKIVEKGKRVKLHKTAAKMSSDLRARTKALWRYPSEVEQMRGFSQKDWNLVDTLSRGSKVAIIEN